MVNQAKVQAQVKAGLLARAGVKARQQVRWGAMVMEESEKDWVREVLGKIAKKACRLTEVQVRVMTRMTVMTDRFTGADRPSATDVVWAWAAEREQEGDMALEEGLARRSRAKHRQPLPRWQWYARNRSGWQRGAAVTLEGVRYMEKADQVLATLWREQTGLEYEEWRDQVLCMEKGTARKGWQKVKKCGFTGEGGYARYLTLIAALMVMGEVEGGVGEVPGEWWQAGARKAAQVTGDETLAQDLGLAQEQVGAECPSVTGRDGLIRVVLDWMACTQSLERAVGPGEMYIGFDIQKWVYSGLARRWVQNEVMDLVKATPEELEEEVKRVVRRRLGLPADYEVQVQVVLVGMSPCCKTFSKADSSNQTRGHHYRDHSHPDRPPKDMKSAKGKEAHQADRMVRKGIQVAEWFEERHGSRFYMENPVGSLRMRPYMRKWVRSGRVVQRQVDYCSYKHWYMKPTNIWTNMQWWRPCGVTGTGQCERRCPGGYKSKSGRWCHTHKLAQESWQAVQGMGRKARKNMMPLMLQQELMAAALWRGDPDEF